MNAPQVNRKALVAWPESPDELLRALQSYARLRAAYPQTEFELVLFCHTVQWCEVEAVLNSERSTAAAEDLLNRYLSAFD
jgi:hypothetical protein